jgi:hypothetical protein
MDIVVHIVQSTVMIIVVHTIHELLHIYILDHLKGLVEIIAQDIRIGITTAHQYESSRKTIAHKRNSNIIIV